MMTLIPLLIDMDKYLPIMKQINPINVDAIPNHELSARRVVLKLRINPSSSSYLL